MGRPEVLDQGFPGLVLQLLQAGGGNAQGQTRGQGFEMALAFAQHLKHNVAHGGIALAQEPSLVLRHQSEGANGYGEPGRMAQADVAEAIGAWARLC